MHINQYIDHTLLKADATSSQIVSLCEEAKLYSFASVCINPSWISLAKDCLASSNVKICTVVGFPLGANSIASKVYEAENAVSMGAKEIDFVMNIGKVKDHDFDYIEKEIKSIVDASKGLIVKVILETCLLTKEEIHKSCLSAVKAKVNFVKTSTGFSSAGANVEDVILMKKSVGDLCNVKASGGIRTIETFNAMINAGATRIGTSSGVYLIQGKENKNEY